jgi:hypothetical protein
MRTNYCARGHFQPSVMQFNVEAGLAHAAMFVLVSV